MNPFDAKLLANKLMEQHNLHCTWGFRFDNAKRRFGYCNYSEKIISLSEPLTWLNDEEKVRDTILHEIAHALAGPKAGHGRLWRSFALAIGCNGMRCYGKEVEKPAAQWIGTCPKCQRKIERLRRKSISCGICSPHIFNPDLLFIWARA